MQNFIKPISPISKDNLEKARAHLDNLTKPRGSLGELENWIAHYAAIKGPESCEIKSKAVVLFAADHGVVEEGVSAYPQEVTAQMVLNFIAGGAAINSLARHAGAELSVVDVGVKSPLPKHSTLLSHKIANGTRNMVQEPAMERNQAEDALNLGYQVAQEKAVGGADLLVAGDMGIGNTTSATAILSVLHAKPPSELTGRGTGIDDATHQNKIRVIEKAINRNQPDSSDPVDVLTKLGGFEIGAMAGFYLGAASNGTPVLIDGVISCAAASLAQTLQPNLRAYLFPGHRSAEPASDAFLEQLDLLPLLDLEMRLGEGTGAVMAMTLLEGGVRLYNEMATFGDAGVSEKNSAQ
ncbi:MAG: nicotinate-nucleotide--dimethylbenzimidazole phosphoribosyltransferase [Candidatus Nitronauta litoralis]|uniref:Nicotinate-nucleotide--dimethylbenzimidazole phosphoribosyltransferase n=1 Tax=Candidatus Nitronauta litoralis TaxID=2705533 RepID=A0A7T0G1M7_9BACT|nr:MAG: nicotinate-nucleotide--dimethylbenzimidazole phosphoribosyltransferase [Candidatus Nitronauta litoralis]